MPKTSKAGAVNAGQRNQRAADNLPQAHSSTRPVYAQGRVVGRMVDGWLVKTGLDPCRHKVRIPVGWATDAEHLEIPGLRGVRLYVKDGSTWTATLAAWRRYGRPLDRGHGRQVVLVDRYWTVTRPGEPVADQLGLWEVAA